MTGPRVAIDVTPLAGTPTGIANSIAELLAALALLETPPVMVPFAISTRALQERSELPEGTRVIPGAAALVKMWGRSDRPRIDRQLDGAALIHATNYLVPPSRLPTLVTMNDCSIIRHRELCAPSVQALEPVLRRAIARGCHVHVPSQFVADETEELLGPGLRAGGRLHVVPYGVPAIVVPPELPSELMRFGALSAGAPFVLAIGTIEPRKNLPHLVAAFGHASAAHRELHLVLAGPDGPARPEVDRAIAQLDPLVAARVAITGPVSDPARGWLLAHAALLAYPSIYEGFGFPLLEAMTVGTPVIAARSGSIPEIAGDAAILVDGTDEQAMAAAITNVLADTARRAQLIERGRAHAATFHWSSCAQGIAARYQDLAG